MTIAQLSAEESKIPEGYVYIVDADGSVRLVKKSDAREIQRVTRDDGNAKRVERTG